MGRGYGADGGLHPRNPPGAPDGRSRGARFAQIVIRGRLGFVDVLNT